MRVPVFIYFILFFFFLLDDKQQLRDTAIFETRSRAETKCKGTDSQISTMFFSSFINALFRDENDIKHENMVFVSR